MKIDLCASMQHYAAHLLPIFNALPDDVKGRVWPVEHPTPAPLPGRAALVASWQDVAQLSGRAPMVYVEHGAGQTYGGERASARAPGYSGSGGERHFGVIGFISPSQEVADRWTTAPSIAVGCPKLDDRLFRFGADPWNVCFAWHWDGSAVSPEAGTAWYHYSVEMPAIVRAFQDQGLDVYGHAHPRWGGQLDPLLADAGMTVLHSDDEVFSTCGTLFVDNSSIGVEQMAFGGTTIWMNTPAYRRDVFHGGRFWDWTIDIPEVDGPQDLIGLDAGTILAWNHDVGARGRIVEQVYAYTDGSSAQRAANWIVDLIGRR